jgi:hypothetical protein
VKSNASKKISLSCLTKAKAPFVKS